MISYRCGHCGAEISVPAGTEGKKARCPGCGKLGVVPFTELRGFHAPIDLRSQNGGAVRPIGTGADSSSSVLAPDSIPVIVVPTRKVAGIGLRGWLFRIIGLAIAAVSFVPLLMGLEADWWVLWGAPLLFSSVAVAMWLQSAGATANGRPTSPHVVPVAEPQSSRVQAIVWIVRGFLVLFLAWYFGGCGGESSSSTSPKPATSSPSSKSDVAKIMAWEMATEFVKQHLKSPSTASFGGILSGEFQDPSKCVTADGSGRYFVRGWVDSQNGFGATLRADFIVQVEDLGDGKWRLVSGPSIMNR